MRDLIAINLLTWEQLYSEALNRPGGFGIGYRDNFRAGRISRRNAASIARYLNERFSNVDKYLPIAAPQLPVSNWEALSRRSASALDVDLHVELPSGRYLVPPDSPSDPKWALPKDLLVYVRLRVRFDCAALVFREAISDDAWYRSGWRFDPEFADGSLIKPLKNGTYTIRLGHTHGVESRWVLLILPRTMASRIAGGWKIHQLISENTLDEIALAVGSNPRARAVAIVIRHTTDDKPANWAADLTQVASDPVT